MHELTVGELGRADAGRSGGFCVITRGSFVFAFSRPPRTAFMLRGERFILGFAIERISL